MVCVVGRMRDLILQLSKSSIYSTKPVYDDIIEAAGELGDKTLLPVLDTMLYKFDDNEIITSAIDKLKRS